jgi:glycosyltransferase involved in cell wall biosynthesis
VSEKSPIELANAIELLSGNPKLRSKITNTAYNHVKKHFDIENNINELIEIFLKKI